MELRDSPDPILGQADNFLAVLEKVSRVAPLSKPVLIIGARGSDLDLLRVAVAFEAEAAEKRKA